MGGYRKTSHSVYDIKYHVVWITKYRKPVLSREVGKRMRELIRQVCTSMDIQIIKGHVSRDHEHIGIRYDEAHKGADNLKYIEEQSKMERAKDEDFKVDE